MSASVESHPEAASEDLCSLQACSAVPDQLPQMWSATAGGVVALYGEIDIATHQAFAAVIDALSGHLGGGAIPRGEAHLDLEHLDFIDVGGARMLVTAASMRGLSDQLVIHHPSAALLRILQVGWGHLPGLRFEDQAQTA